MKLKIFLLPLLLSGWIHLSSQDTLTLLKAIETGLENNYSIIIQKNTAEIASNNNTIGNAGFLPDVALTGTQNNTFTNTHQDMFNGTTKDVSGAKNKSFNAGAELNWTVFDGFSMFVNKNMLNVLEQMGETDSRLVIENTVSSIILNYYGIIQQEKMIQVLRDAADLSLQRKKIAEAKESLGAGSRLELLQATVDLNADSTNLIQEVAAVMSTKADLNLLLAREPEIPFIAIDTISLTHPLSYDSLLEQARTQNTNLLLARSNMDLSTLALKDARSQRYPILDLQAGYNYSQLNSQTGFLHYNQSYGPSYGFTLSYPIFDGFNVNRTIRNAKVEINSSEKSYLLTELDIQANLFKLFIDYTANLQIVKLQMINKDVARENVDVAFEKYRLGAISDIDLRETQRKFIDAQYQLILSQFRAKKSEIELLRISGELYRTIID